MKYKIIADSSCDLTPELKKELAVEIAPLSMSLGTEVFIDNEELDVDGFIKRMNEYKHQAKSSCPSPYEFMEKCAKDGTTFIVTLSSKLSGSYSSAVIARDMLSEQGVDSYVFDSKSASAGEILVVKELRDLIDKGLGRQEIIRELEDFIDNMETFFVVDNLDNLVKNGRMSKVTGLIAGALNIKLLLKSDGHGEIILHSKARGLQNAVIKLAAAIGDVCKETAGRILSITHCGSRHVDMFVEIVREKYLFKDIIIASTRGLSGMYANEGGIVIAF